MKERIKKHYDLDEIKSKFNIRYSEQIFDITEEIPVQCPRIDSFIRDIYDIEKHLQRVRDMTDNCATIDRPYIDREFEILKLSISTVVNQIEELRVACEKLRSRGTEWKKMAKELFEELPDNGKYVNKDYRK